MAIALNLWNNEIHRALAHPIRRCVIQSLRNRNLSFTELLKCTGINNHGKIGFHLRALHKLVELDPSTGKYRLTDRGKLASDLIENIHLTLSKGEQDTRLIDYAQNLRLRDHAVLFYHTEDFKRKILFPFLEAGVSKGEAVIYLTPEYKLNSETREIQKYGIDLDRQEAFIIMSADEWYLKKGKAQAKTITTNWLTLIKEKQKAGFTGTRVAGEMEVFFNYTKTEELLRYEKSLGRKLTVNMCALCLYNINRLGENQFIQVINSHGHLISKDMVGKTTI